MHATQKSKGTSTAKKVVPTVLAVLGLLLLGIGIGQRTIWLPPSQLTAEVKTAEASQGKDVSYAMIDPTVLSQSVGDAKLTVKNPGDGKIYLAQGRSFDVAGWLGNTSYLKVNGADFDRGTLKVDVAEGSGPKADPAGSDLWVKETSGKGEMTLNFPTISSDQQAVLIASDGEQAVPAQLSITVPNDQSTPWAMPLMFLGILLLLAALIAWWLLGRTPKQSSGRRAANSDPAADDDYDEAYNNAPNYRVVARPRTVLTALVLVGTLSLPVAGMATADDNTPSAPADATQAPTPAQETGASETPQQGGQSSHTADSGDDAILGDDQFTRILTTVATTVGNADSAKDANLLGDRVGGQALRDRTANYQIKAAAPGYKDRDKVASSELLSRILPNNKQWPRTTIAVTKGQDNAVPQILTLVQESARDNYKLMSTSRILPGQTLPKPEKQAQSPGSVTDASGSAATPIDAATRLGQVLQDPNDAARSQFADSKYLEEVKNLQEKLVNDSKEAKFTFKHELDPNSIKVFHADANSLMVMANYKFTITADPGPDNATLTLTDDGSKALAGRDSTTKGYTLEFTENAVMVIPPTSQQSGIAVVAAENALVGANVKQ